MQCSLLVEFTKFLFGPQPLKIIGALNKKSKLYSLDEPSMMACLVLTAADRQPREVGNEINIV